MGLAACPRPIALPVPPRHAALAHSLLPPTLGCLGAPRGLFTSCPGRARWEVSLLSQPAGWLQGGQPQAGGALQLHCGQQGLAWAQLTPNSLR